MHIKTELQITSRENDQSFMLQLGPLDYNIAHKKGVTCPCAIP